MTKTKFGALSLLLAVVWLSLTAQTHAIAKISFLDDALKTGLPVVLKLGSDKCRPCLAMNPVMKELAKEQDGKTVFLALDVYQNRDLANKYGVRLIPTIIFFDKHGRLKAKREGFMNKMQLLKAVDDLGLNK